MIRWTGALAPFAAGGLLFLMFAGCGGSPDRPVAEGHPAVVPGDLAAKPDAVPLHRAALEDYRVVVDAEP